MANAQETPLPPERENLHTRAAKYQQDIEQIVSAVGEHPLYEFKRTCDLNDLTSRIEFVKDIQAIATSAIADEKYLVIGADEKARTFENITNLSDFDEARLRQLLGKFLSPCPNFEVLHLKIQANLAFVLIVVPRQSTRRILAKSTVTVEIEKKTKLLLREGDLWTKGNTTAKHLARPEDWDAIYEDTIEREAEARTKRRTAHFLEQALASQRIKDTTSVSSIPAFTTDAEFSALIEGICLNGDAKRLGVLLEHLRDDVIEGWHRVGAFGNAAAVFTSGQQTFEQKAAEYRDAVFRPAMARLTVLGMLLVKNNAGTSLLVPVTSLIREVFDASHDMMELRRVAAGKSTDPKDHLSHTLPALECLIAMHLIGAYVLKRRRFPFFYVLLQPTVFISGKYLPSEQEKQEPLAFWPLQGGGAPGILRTTAGRIDLCLNRIRTDGTLLNLFGSDNAALTSLLEYDFCLEFISYLAVDEKNAPDTAAAMRRLHPETLFTFHPSFLAFPLSHLDKLVSLLWDEVSSCEHNAITQLVPDVEVLRILQDRPGLDTVLRFLQGVKLQHSQLMMSTERWLTTHHWPEKVEVALKSLKSAQ